MADGFDKKFEEDFFKKLLDNLYEGVYICDLDRKITYWNRAAEKITGYRASEVIGSHCWNNILNHTDAKGNPLCSNGQCPAIRAMKEQRLVEEEVYLKHKEGYRVPIITRISPMKDADGKVSGAVELFSDSSSKIAAFQKIEKLEQLAFIDSLTGAGNRRYSEIKITAKLEEMDRYEWAGRFGLIFMDIDRFKDFNDTYGHEAGDRVLRLVSKTVMTSLRQDDFIGRWGGEEFVAVISNVEANEFAVIAEKLRRLVERSAVETQDGSQLQVTVSAGATLARRDDGMKSLVDRADRLMYVSKHNGRNRVTMDDAAEDEKSADKG